MRTQFTGWVMALVAVTAVLCVLTAPAAGQTPTAAAKTWDPPRTPDGQPDMQGVWAQQGLSIPSYSIEEGPSEEHYRASGQQRPASRPSAIVDPPDGKAPYQPWAAAQRKDVYDNHNNLFRQEHVDPQDRCFLNGVPRHLFLGEFQILQPPGQVVILNAFAHAYRVISLDGRPDVGGTIKLWMGSSRGRWEGNTLVVDTTNLNDKTWFDKVGSFHSDALRVVERFTFVDANTIRYQATIDDPKVFTRPWTLALTFAANRENGYELFEEACYEGEVWGHKSFATLKRPRDHGKDEK